jgi:hypothetical protein
MFGLNPVEILVIGVVSLFTLVLPLAACVGVFVLLYRSSQNRRTENCAQQDAK